MKILLEYSRGGRSYRLSFLEDGLEPFLLYKGKVWFMAEQAAILAQRVLNRVGHAAVVYLQDGSEWNGKRPE